jgi:hypothetical protein
VARAAAASGDTDVADSVVGNIDDTAVRTEMSADLTIAASAAGNHARAAAIVRTIGASLSPATLTKIVDGLAEAPHMDGSAVLLDEISNVIDNIANSSEQVTILSRLAHVMALNGDVARASAVALATERTARSFVDRVGQTRERSHLAQAAATSGAWPQAIGIAESIGDDQARIETLRHIVESLASAGQRPQAETIARSVPDKIGRTFMLLSIAHSAVSEDPELAVSMAQDIEKIARSLRGAEQRGLVLSALARTVAALGRRSWARTLLTDVQELARSIGSWDHQATVLTSAAMSAVAAGEQASAETITREVKYLDQRLLALSALSVASERVGDHRHAITLVNEIETVARRIPIPDWQGQVLSNLAVAAALAGDQQRGEAIARSVPAPARRARTLGELARIIQPVDERRAAGLANEADQACHDVSEAEDQAQVMADLAEGSHPPRGRALLTQALAAGRWTTPLQALARFDPPVVRTFVMSARYPNPEPAAGTRSSA